VPNPKGQPTVYVSSTFNDLEAHRAALKTALEKSRYDVECMEKYTAFDEPPLDRCLADVAAMDVYVLLIAHRYGFRPPENNPQRRSITHLEYEQASRHNKPRLVFTVDRKQLWLPDWIDGGDDAADLAAFRAEVEATHGVNRFNTPDQLASLVLQALQALRPPSLDSGSLRTRIYTPADLQSWVDRHQRSLSDAFLGLASVQARQVHVPLDVCLTLAGAGAVVTEGPRLLKPVDLQPLLAAAGSHVLLLSGDGGAGKTSLAFAIARWWLTGELDGVVRLPVLIETALAEGETVARKVRAWLEEQLGEPQAAELVAALLRGRRLVPILDHVSELAPAARQRLLAGLPPGLVIATSRSADDGWKGRALSQIAPRPIALDRLQSFFVEYLKGRGQGDVLRDDELVPAQNQLRRIVGDKPITALLAQMFIDDVIANRQRGLLAGSVPQLMLSYVRRLDTPVDPSQRERAGLTIDGERVQRALKCLALASHRQLGGDGEPAYQPREFSRALAKETLQQPEPDGLGLNGEAAEGVLGYLGERRLLVHPGEDSSELRFPLDPLADYLAALAQLEVLETTSWSTGPQAAWEPFLAGLEQRLKQAADLSRSRGFFLALRDAALERRGRGVPEAVPDRLAELGGLNPERERERLAEQRARKWMWELLVPIASERRDAISKLAAMAAAAAEPEDRRSVAVVASDRLSQVLANGDPPGEERQEAAVVLGLIGTEIGIEALEGLAGDGGQTPELRRTALEALGLTARDQAAHRTRIEEFLEGQLRADTLDLLVTGEEGWAEHDRRLPPLQGASRAMQLAASADLPLLGSGPGRLVPMLTLTALQEGEALRIRTEVVTPAVWKLPLPGGEQLELVVVPGGEYVIGSPREEAGRDIYPQYRLKCEGVNVEAERRVALKDWALVRHPLSQAQWKVVAELPQVGKGLNTTPGSFLPNGLWETHAQPDSLPVDSVSWHDCQEWLQRLNRWLKEQWLVQGSQGEVPKLALPSQSQWEVACRAGASTPFHFGDTLDSSWANYFGLHTYGTGRMGAYRQRLMPVGFFGLVNRWGLVEMHGQLFEWCADQWQRDPLAGDLGDGAPVEGFDPGLVGTPEQACRLLCGGCWWFTPRDARAAVRSCGKPGYVAAYVGIRPGAFSPGHRPHPYPTEPLEGIPADAQEGSQAQGFNLSPVADSPIGKPSSNL
jgi:formylglycine-generating enzyme required for sulfatase activity